MTSTAPRDPTPSVFTAREPIVDRRQRLMGYRVRVRESEQDVECAPVAEAKRTTDALYAVGLDAITRTQRAFVPVSRRLLLEGIPAVWPAANVVVELGSVDGADRDVLEACRALRSADYAIALDAPVLDASTADLLSLASYVKFDTQAATDQRWRDRTMACIAPGVTAIVATGVDTFDQFEAAAAAGFSAFQGFFLGRPLLLPKGPVQAQQVALLRVMRVLNDPNLSMGQLEDLVSRDAALCYRILRTVNSAAYGLQMTITSIERALVLIGRDPVRRWASAWLLAGLNGAAHSELVVMATIRGRCAELLAASAGDDELAGEAFLLGMCSLLDALLGKPMSAIVEELPLSDRMKRALNGEANRMRHLLDCVIGYERGHWAEAEARARLAGVDARMLPGAYVNALNWCREFQHSAE